MLLNVIVVILIIIAMIVSYLIGLVNGVSQDVRLYQKYNDCQRNCCIDNYSCGKICLYPTEIKIREEQAYYRGKYEEQVKKFEDFRMKLDETEEMTMEKVCKELGREVKIRR